MRRQSKTGRVRRTDKKKSATAPSLKPIPTTLDVYADPFLLSTCYVCGGVEDEDLIILCDGPGCTNEVHMYCLTPIMTAVPEGDWFCESCESQGTTRKLRQYFADFEETTKEFRSTSVNQSSLQMLLQQRMIPLEAWSSSLNDEFIPCEFDISSVDLIGCIARISITPVDQHTGRIVDRRFNEDSNSWKHLIRFKR